VARAGHHHANPDTARGAKNETHSRPEQSDCEIFGDFSALEQVGKRRSNGTRRGQEILVDQSCGADYVPYQPEKNQRRDAHEPAPC